MTDDDVMDACAEFGLVVRAVRRQGDVLVLVPAALRDLPPPEELARLARRLTQHTDARYVTIAIDQT